jgi:hypothetical protein
VIQTPSLWTQMEKLHDLDSDSDSGQNYFILGLRSRTKLACTETQTVEKHVSHGKAAFLEPHVYLGALTFESEVYPDALKFESDGLAFESDPERTDHLRSAGSDALVFPYGIKDTMHIHAYT